MTMAIEDRSQEILALGPSLLGWASALSRDDAEAQALVRETLSIANAPGAGPSGTESTQAWLHGLLRRRFYSVERDRDYRRSTSAAVTELGYARKRALAAQAAAAETP